MRSSLTTPLLLHQAGELATAKNAKKGERPLKKVLNPLLQQRPQQQQQQKENEAVVKKKLFQTFLKTKLKTIFYNCALEKITR